MILKDNELFITTNRFVKVYNVGVQKEEYLELDFDQLTRLKDLIEQALEQES
jgi:hypothetical protein